MKTVHYTVHREGDDYIARCLDHDVTSSGATQLEALRHLQQAVELHLQGHLGTPRGPRISEMSFGELAIA